MNIFSDYDPFARMYNMHWGNNFIPLVFPMLEKYILKDLAEGSRILDLCCGTGQLARLLNDRGYRVTGIDGSPGMLEYAGENAPDVELINADARSFDLPDTFDAAVSVFDSLNHIMSIEELTSVFVNVYRSLRPLGAFFFDLNMEAGFRSGWSGSFDIVEEDDVCVFRTSYSAEEKTAYFYATIFHREEEWLRTDITLVQKCYTEEEVLSALEEAGFACAGSYAADINSSLTELTGDSERAFFIARKS